LSYRGEQDHRAQFDFVSTISLLGPSDLKIITKSSLFYDPETVMVGISRYDDLESYSFSAHWQRWGNFRGTTLAVNVVGNFSSSFSQALPETWHHDIISLHAGYERRFGNSALRLGYAFVPTHVPDQSGQSNILDSDRHEASLGYGHKWQSSFIDGALRIDGCLMAHFLAPKTVTKTSGEFIGAPGYKIGGTVYGYGMTMTAEY
jgi:hypothetical protein